MKKTRPKNLDLTTMRVTAPALVSILHRISGVSLFLLTPLLLLALQTSLQSEQQFLRLATLLAHPLAKLLLALLWWGLLHHLLAGIRHFALDLGYGVRRQSAKMSGWLVLVASVVLSLSVTAWIG